MKNKITQSIFLILLISINSFSQKLQEQKKGNPTPPSFNYDRPSNCALNTSFLMMDLKQNKDLEYIKSLYSLTEIDGVLYVGAFFKIDKDAFNRANVEKLGVKLNTEAGDFFTSLIPINSLENLFSVKGVVSVEIADKVKSTMDYARTLTNVNQVHAGTGLPQAYTGNGVVVGVIDSGFDYTHPNFRNLNTQQIRISRVWEQTETGTPPTGFNYGNEIIGATNILANSNDNNVNGSRGSHGTHVTGIASGSGGIVNSPNKGIAYDSELVLVPTNMTDISVLHGLDYIFDYSTSVNKPAVINLSLGKHIGPHDGTSFFDSASTSMLNHYGNNGKIIIGSAGNQGNDKIHLNKSFSSTNNTSLSFIKFPYSSVVTNGSATIDLWGTVGTNFEVAVNIYNIITNQYIEYTSYVSTSNNSNTYQGTIYDGDTSNAPDGCIVQISVETANTNNNKPHAMISINNSLQDDSFKYVLLEIKSTTVTVNAWCSASNSSVIFDNLGSTSTIVTDGDTNMTIGEIGGTGNSIISVGSYNSKSCTTMYFNNNNPKCTFDVNTGLFGIADSSSKGPTADGRIKPDITAPGNRIVSSVSRFDNSYVYSGGTFNNTTDYSDVVSGLTDNTNTWYFAAMQGTSMAAPVVTGIVALWLQANPNLTIAQIKTILQNTSITDSYTGTGSAIPNNTWGRGKINALTGAQYINQFLNIDTFNNSNSFVVYPNPTTSKIYITSIDYVGNYEIFNTVGQKISEGSFNSILDEKELDLSSLPSGLYILNFKGANSNKSVRIIKQ